MMKKQSFLIIFSALSFAAAFAWPQYVDFLIFIFLIPLFYLGLQSHSAGTLDFWQGYCWGLIFYFATSFSWWHCTGYSNYKTLYCFVARILITFHLAAFPAGWFWIASSIGACSNSLAYNAFVWGITAIGYFYSIDYFYNFNGLNNPLMPLVYRYYWLHVLSLLSEHVLLLCLIISSLFFAASLHTKEYYQLLIGILFLAPFIYGFFLSSCL